MIHVFYTRLLFRELARARPKPKFIEEPDAGDQQVLTDEERRQKVSVSTLCYICTHCLGKTSAT